MSEVVLVIACCLPPSLDGFMSSENTTPQQPKRKKLDVKDVFNQDDDDMPAKKKKLPLPGERKRIRLRLVFIPVFIP